MTKLALMLPVALLGLSACVDPSASSYTSTSYTAQSPRSEYGTVIRVENVRTQASSGNQLAGTIIGGVAGAAIGNQFGNGSGNALATGAGAVGGALIGSNIAANAAQTTNVQRQITVRLESGSTIALVQNSGSYRVGQSVRVIYDGNVTRLQ